MYIHMVIGLSPRSSGGLISLLKALGCEYWIASNGRSMIFEWDESVPPIERFKMIGIRKDQLRLVGALQPTEQSVMQHEQDRRQPSAAANDATYNRGQGDEQGIP